MGQYSLSKCFSKCFCFCHLTSGAQAKNTYTVHIRSSTISDRQYFNYSLEDGIRSKLQVYSRLQQTYSVHHYVKTLYKRELAPFYKEISRVVTDHVLLQYVRVTFRLCPFLPTMRGRLDWYVIQRSQKQELLGNYAFNISTIAVSQFPGGTDRVNLPSRLRVRE